MWWYFLLAAAGTAAWAVYTKRIDYESFIPSAEAGEPFYSPEEFGYVWPSALLMVEEDQPSLPISNFAGTPNRPVEAWEDFSSFQVAEAIKKWSRLAGLDERFVAAIISVESSFNPEAVNPADFSQGLMQIQPLIGRAYGGWTDAQGVDKLRDIDINLRAGTTFLLHLLQKYGNMGDAIEAYNLGETKFNKGVKSPTYRAKVLSAYVRFGGAVL